MLAAYAAHRRTSLPVKDTDGKGIDLLMRLCNFANAETECLAIAWLIGCLGPSVPVPAPFLTGPQERASPPGAGCSPESSRA